MKKRSLLCGILALSMMFSACARKSAAPSTGASGAMNKAVAPQESLSMKTADTANTVNQKAEAKPEAKTTAGAVVDQEKKIIRNASLYIVDESLANLSESINKKAEELGGYIESENVMEGRLDARVRVPSDKFDAFITYAENGFAVKNKTISSDNITDAYVDNEARLKNLRAQEEQVLTILKKANTVEEVLKVQAELYRIRGEAEALDARKKSWDRQVDYATITISASRKAVVVDNKKTILGGSEFIKSITTGFNNTGVTLVLAVQNILIFVFSNIIVLALLALAGFAGFKYYKKYNKK